MRNEDFNTFIRENISKLTTKEIAEHLGITEKAVSGRRERMKLKVVVKQPRVESDSWDKCTVQFLKESYLTLTDTEIGKILNKTPKSVNSKRTRLGLIKDKTNKKLFVCEECGKEEYFKESLAIRKRFCSHECREMFFTRKYTKTCKFCETVFVAEKLKQIYCSRQCVNDANEYQFRKNNPTNLEEIGNGLLTVLGFNYKTQYKIDKYYADVYIEEYNLVIEWFGDYWHMNPNKFDADERAIKIHSRDSKRILKLKSLGYNVLYFWESDVYTNLKFVKKTLFDEIDRIKQIVVPF